MIAIKSIKPIDSDEDLYSFQHQVIQRQIETEEKCVKAAIAQVVNRDVIDEVDGPRITRIERSGVYDRYGLMYDNIFLGTIVRKWEDCTFTVTFIPDENPNSQIKTL